jgi:uncharacterized membrane protein YbhN (UPF0104 family)
LRRWHRLAISAAALAILLNFIPVGSLVDAMRQVPIGVLAVTLTVFLLGHALAAMKWRMLQGPDAHLPVIATLRAHFSGVVANLWLPGVVGGDLVRVGVVYRQSSRPAAVALASLVDRIIDSVALVTLAFCGLLAVNGPARDARRMFVAVAIAGVVGLAALAGAYAWFKKRMNEAWTRQLRDAVDLLVKRPAAVAAAFALSAVVQSAFILANEQLGLAVGVAVPVAVWFMAWPLSKLIALVPVSAAGLGIREAAIVMLMRPFTTSTDAVMASSLLWQALLFTGGFVGWCLLSVAAAVPGGRRALQSSRE